MNCGTVRSFVASFIIDSASQTDREIFDAKKGEIERCMREGARGGALVSFCLLKRG